MSEPILEDKAARGEYYDGEQEVECEDCGWQGTVGTTEEVSGGEVTWYAEWKCLNCDERHTSEGWYEAEDPDRLHDEMGEW